MAPRMADRSSIDAEVVQEVYSSGSIVVGDFVLRRSRLLDNVHLQELVQISNTLTYDNIGDFMMSATVVKAAIANPETLVTSDRLLEKVRGFARGADIGWRL